MDPYRAGSSLADGADFGRSQSAVGGKGGQEHGELVRANGEQQAARRLGIGEHQPLDIVYACVPGGQIGRAHV